MTFDVDRKNKQIHVEREFAAPVETVWSAWTQSEFLDQWWAPKPWKAETKIMDFRVGGRWLYAMVSPDGNKHWSLTEYKSVAPQKNYTGLVMFCDESGNANADTPRSLWNNTFNADGDSTVVDILIKFDKLEDLEMLVGMGFEGGFKMGLSNLDELLEKK